MIYDEIQRGCIMPHKNIEELCGLNVYEDELCRPLTGQSTRSNQDMFSFGQGLLPFHPDLSDLGVSLKYQSPPPPCWVPDLRF